MVGSMVVHCECRLNACIADHVFFCVGVRLQWQRGNWVYRGIRETWYIAGNLA